MIDAQKKVEIARENWYKTDCKGLSAAVIKDAYERGFNRAYHLMKSQEQIRWERDVAIEQLRSIGKELGQTMDDIQALLKVHEPRIVTAADFENNPNLDEDGYLNVWEEYKDGSRCGWNTICVNDASAFLDIRRFWTSRPTTAQRKAVKWDD